jgi:hypothetical protein
MAQGGGMMVEQAVADAPDAQPKDPFASISGHLSVLSTGEHALLRRMFLTGRPAADGAVVKLLLHAGMKPQDYQHDYAAWRLVVHVAAQISGTGKAAAHDPRRGLGTALHAAGLSENRIIRLTAATGDALQDQAVLAGRMLAQAGGAINLRTLLHLVGRDPKRAEQARIRIAQDYYAAAARQEGEAK